MDYAVAFMRRANVVAVYVCSPHLLLCIHTILLSLFLLLPE